MLETVSNEILFLDEMIQLYEGIREIVLANDRINKENEVFWLMTVTFFDSAMVRLRRLVDRDSRAISVVTLIDHIEKYNKAFTHEWHRSMYTDTQILKYHEPRWWKARADSIGC